MRRRAAGEEGSVLVLLLGLTGILLVLVAVVVDVSAVVLARRAVASAADGAALGAAQAVDLEQVYAGALGEQVPLDPARAAGRVAALQGRLAAGQPGLSLTVRVDGRTAVVTGSRTVRLPLRVPGGPGEVTVVATASAEAPTAP